jgi:hypothetical protein
MNPISSVFKGSDWTVPMQEGATRITYPFRYFHTRILEEDFTQDQAYYEPLPLDTQHPEYPDHYLVENVPPQPLGGGACKFTRRWAQIPEARREYEGYSFTKFGIEYSSYFVGLKDVSSAYITGGVYRIVTTADHGFSVGDPVIVKYTVTDQVNNWNFTYQLESFRTVLNVVNTTTFDVQLVTSSFGPVSIYQCSAPNYSREPFTKVVSSWLQYEYFLEGVSTGINSFLDIPVEQAFTVIDSAGNETQTLSESTTPSIADYKLMIANKVPIVAEESVVQRWEGNIYQKITRYVYAT